MRRSIFISLSTFALAGLGIVGSKRGGTEQKMGVKPAMPKADPHSGPGEAWEAPSTGQ